MDLSALSDRDRMRVLQHIEQKEVKDTMMLHVKLSNRCFHDCVNDFTSRAVSSKEEACISKCVEKFSDFLARVSQRFPEAQQKFMPQNEQQ